jgi:hypothetical protein
VVGARKIWTANVLWKVNVK